jgi:transcriptional regulator with XRE-family HTH domain
MKFLVSHDVQYRFAEYLRAQRRAQKLSRERLAVKSSVPAPTIKRFELTGEISFRQLCLLWETLDDLNRLDGLCHEGSMPTTIEEVLADVRSRR